MYTIKLDVNDIIYDKVMFFLNNIPVTNLEVEQKNDVPTQKKDDIVNFFQTSPLKGEISLHRDKESYSDRVVF